MIILLLYQVKFQEYLDEHFCQNWCAFRRIMNPSINDSLFHDAIYKRRNIIKIFDLDWGGNVSLIKESVKYA